MTETVEVDIDRLDRFNARDLTASEVAESFVQPKAFQRICDGSNTLLIGPRGSGKTTLLKMLTPEGLERLGFEEADPGRPAFNGIYVPIDVQLADRLESVAAARLEEPVAEIVCASLYALHVFRCITETLAWHCPSSRRRSQSSSMSRAQEAEAVDALGNLWGIVVDVPTVSALQIALRTRHARALELWNRQVLRIHSGESVSLEELDIVDLDSGMKGAVDVLRSLPAWPTGRRWAVLFDEVEIAPEILQRQLLSYLRYSDPAILFKVAIAPYMQSYRGLSDRNRASALNDYRVINLQSHSEADIEAFTAAYFERATQLRFGRSLSLGDALGPSILAGASGGTDTEASYGSISTQARRFRMLARKDNSFANYLEKLDFSLDDFVASGDSNSRAPFRKARQVALVREAYLAGPSSGRRIATKNSADRLYVGAAGVTRICEGNPRRIAFITPMLIAGLDVATDRIPFQVQSDAIIRTDAAFRSFLRGLPVTEDLGTSLPRGVLSFVDMLGRFFHDQLTSEQFNDDPVGSFTVDSNASASVEELVARALNSGAIVQLSDSDDKLSQRIDTAFEPLTTSRGKRFRISYLLAPHYGLTLRVGRSISLGTLMKRSADNGHGNQRRVANHLISEQDRLW